MFLVVVCALSLQISAPSIESAADGSVVVTVDQGNRLYVIPLDT
jgi:hypothetical protein